VIVVAAFPASVETRPGLPATVFVECREAHFFVDATATQAAGLIVSPGW